MKLPARQLSLCAALVVVSLPAHAYLDPGTGSALIQGLIAAVAAVGVTLKLYWHRIKRFFQSRRDEKSPNGAGSEKP